MTAIAVMTHAWRHRRARWQASTRLLLIGPAMLVGMGGLIGQVEPISMGGLDGTVRLVGKPGIDGKAVLGGKASPREAAVLDEGAVQG